MTLSLHHDKYVALQHREAIMGKKEFEEEIIQMANKVFPSDQDKKLREIWIETRIKTYQNGDFPCGDSGVEYFS